MCVYVSCTDAARGVAWHGSSNMLTIANSSLRGDLALFMGEKFEEKEQRHVFVQRFNPTCVEIQLKTNFGINPDL